MLDNFTQVDSTSKRREQRLKAAANMRGDIGDAIAADPAYVAAHTTHTECTRHKFHNKARCSFSPAVQAIVKISLHTQSVTHPIIRETCDVDKCPARDVAAIPVRLATALCALAVVIAQSVPPPPPPPPPGGRLCRVKSIASLAWLTSVTLVVSALPSAGICRFQFANWE